MLSHKKHNHKLIPQTYISLINNTRIAEKFKTIILKIVSKAQKRYRQETMIRRYLYKFQTSLFIYDMNYLIGPQS